VPLEEAVNISRLSRSIELPSIVQQCITYINAKGLDEEGIYRIPGSTTKVNHVKYLYNSGQPVNLELDMVDLHGYVGGAGGQGNFKKKNFFLFLFFSLVSLVSLNCTCASYPSPCSPAISLASSRTLAVIHSRRHRTH